MYRFVILHHRTAANEHWDVMLETDTALTTWSIPPQLPIGASFVCESVRLPDHRKHYLDYEGEITDNRGTVSRIDTGTYEWLSQATFFFHGAVFTGTLAVDGDKMVFLGKPKTNE